MSKYRDVPVSVLVGALRGQTLEQKLTGVPLPVKVVLGVAVTSQVKTALLIRRAVSEGNVPVGDVVKEVNLILLEHEARGDGMHWSIAPSLVEEAAIAVEGLEEVDVLLGPEPA